MIQAYENKSNSEVQVSSGKSNKFYTPKRFDSKTKCNGCIQHAVDLFFKV